jgi:uncharacterized protein
MQCPVDGTELKMSDREGVEIDYCPKCRGVWLDRGELDKIIQRTNKDARSRNNDDEEDDENPRGGRNRRRNDRDNDDDEGGFLGNIFGGFGGRDND